MAPGRVGGRARKRGKRRGRRNETEMTPEAQTHHFFHFERCACLLAGDAF